MMSVPRESGPNRLFAFHRPDRSSDAAARVTGDRARARATTRALIRMQPPRLLDAVHRWTLDGPSQTRMTVDMARVDPPRVANIADLRNAAKNRLPRVVFDYIDGGADAEWTLRENS